MYDGNLYRRTAGVLQFAPAEDERIIIMEGLHNEIGHWDFATTYQIITDGFWWSTMRPDIAHFVRSCDPYQKTDPPERRSPYGEITVSGLFQTWSIDFAGPLKETEDGNRYLLLAVEQMSCWPIACAIGTEIFNGAGVINCVIDKICWLYGNPVRIVCDGDSNFDNGAVRLCIISGY